MNDAETEEKKLKVKRKYLQNYGLASYHSQTMQVTEEKRPDPKCPNGHIMNFEPMTTLIELKPIIKKIETMQRMRPGTLLSGGASCIG